MGRYAFHKGTYYVVWCDSDGRSYDRDLVYDLEDIWKDILYNTYQIRASFHIAVGEVETDCTWHVIITAMFEEGQPYRVIHSCLDNGDRPGFSVEGFWTCEEAQEDAEPIEGETTLYKIVEAS